MVVNVLILILDLTFPYAKEAKPQPLTSLRPLRSKKPFLPPDKASSTEGDIKCPSPIIKRSTIIFYEVPFGRGAPVHQVHEDPMNEKKLKFLGADPVSFSCMSLSCRCIVKTGDDNLVRSRRIELLGNADLKVGWEAR